MADLLTRECADPGSGSPWRKYAYLRFKRVLDLVIAGALLLLTSPVLLVAMLLVLVDSPGAPIFVQERVGSRYHWRGGRLVWRVRIFRCYKLRSMVSHCSATPHREYLRRFRRGEADEGPQSAPFKLSGDARVTRVGRLLRMTSVDELPQLLNVLKGEMSLVGPRPVPLYELELYEEEHYERLLAQPGITGLWQVYGRSRVTFEQMMQLDISYARRCSLWLDLKLLLLTVPSVLSSRGAV
jgi:lipopolysaccharide/colanic/teichoic acid biosynthesis glycosyltransferase